jgi:hypothetical protein
VVDVSATTNTRSTDSSGAEVTTTRNNEILVRAADSETYEIENGKPSFSNSGDSGSVVVNSSNQVIGLLYGGSDPANATIHAFVSHISTVLTALSSAGQAITLSNSPGAGGSSDFATATAPARAVITGTHLDDILVRVLGDAPADDPLIQGVQQHFDEMLHLVNHNRSVTVTWHRNKGPAFLAAFMRSSKEPAYRIPLEIDGVSRQQAVTAMVAALREHGSDSLRAALDRYSLEVMLACSRGDTIEEIIRSLHEARSPQLVAEISPL